jgi:hypothetical protein
LGISGAILARNDGKKWWRKEARFVFLEECGFTVSFFNTLPQKFFS